MTQKICLFNHKGGVGKTTLTINIAAAIADEGKRVLLVDCDPQCNLTAYVIEASVVDSMLDESEQETGSTIWTSVKPIVDGSGPYRYLDPIQLSHANLRLVPGDIRLAYFESELNDFWAQAVQRRPKGYTGTMAISNYVDEVCRRLNIDFVFFDTGPNIGALNRAIILCCDYFIVPVACDLFSVRAIKTLGQALSRWTLDWEAIVNIAPKDQPLFKGRPKFLGYILQGFRTYGDFISKEPAKYVPLIDKAIKNDLIPVLPPDMVGPRTSSTGFRIGQIRHLGAIVTASQTQGLAMYRVRGQPDNVRVEARTAFRYIARRVMDRVEKD